MKKRMKSFAALFAAMTIALGAVPSVTMADSNYSQLTTNDGATQGNTTAENPSDGDALFTKSLIVESEANIPDVGFTFEITAQSSGLVEDKYIIKSDDTSKLSILAGINPEAIVVSGYDIKDAAVVALGTASTNANNSGDFKGSYYEQSGDDKKTTVYLKYNAQKFERTYDNDTKEITGVTENTENDGIKVVDRTSTSNDYIANKAILLDFGACHFTEPGVYRYIITETGSDNSTIDNDTITKRTIDVYVTNADSANTLEVTGYVIYTEDDDNDSATTADDGNIENAAPATDYSTGYPVTSVVSPESGNKMEDGITALDPNGNEAVSNTDGHKSSGFVNKYDTANLTIGKRVDGNQGSKDKYFKFTIQLSGLEGISYIDVSEDAAKTHFTAVTDGVNAATNSNYTKEIIEAANTTNQIAVTGGTATVSYYLTNADYVTLTGIPKNATYRILEDEEDYKQTIYGDVANDATSTGLKKVVDYVNHTSASIEPQYTHTATGDNAIALSDGTTTYDIAEKMVVASEETKLTDIEYAFQNEKSGVLPTGIIMSVAPAVAVGLLVLAAIFGLVIGGKRKELEEE